MNASERSRPWSGLWLRSPRFIGRWMAVAALAGGGCCGTPTGQAADVDSAKAKILIVTGMDYPGHHWRQTWPILAAALRQDPRLEVFTIEDPHFLDSTALDRYDAAVMHWQNWEQPAPGSKARSNLKRFVEQGGGVALVHFACGAWHGEWKGYGDVAGRVWFGPGPDKVQHDPYGPFIVRLTQSEHPVIRGLNDFETSDELYTCLVGDHPIEVLAEADSKATGQVHPIAFVSHLGKGRTFHCTLGHDVKALSVPEVQKLYRRGIGWAAGFDLEP